MSEWCVLVEHDAAEAWLRSFIVLQLVKTKTKTKKKELSVFVRISNCSAVKKKKSLVLGLHTCIAGSFWFSILSVMPVAEEQHKHSCVYSTQTIDCT